jgi:sigma-B regulation protein RsbU (phosphoserine phosphatase)
MAVRYKPANKLGGDVYDLIRLEGKRLAVLMVDISGHGVNAALLSGMVKTLATPLILADQEPGQVLAGLDVAAEQFFPEGYFCTAFYLRLDETTGTFDYAGVGHPPVVIVGPGGARLLDSEAGLLGVGIGAATATHSETLAPRESLLLYTDGLPDAMDPADKPFGTDRIKEVLLSNQGEVPATILDRIEETVAQHVQPGQPHDDINLVLVQHPSAAG